MNSFWQWMRDFHFRAVENGDFERMQLAILWERSVELSYERPDEKLAILEQAGALARKLNEPYWDMFFDHWKIEVLLYEKHQPAAALKLAARSAFEVRKPLYDAFAYRPQITLSLTACYLKLDPIGYEPMLREAFEYARGAVPKRRRTQTLFRAAMVAFSRSRRRARCRRSELATFIRRLPIGHRTLRFVRAGALMFDFGRLRPIRRTQPRRRVRPTGIGTLPHRRTRPRSRDVHDVARRGCSLGRRRNRSAQTLRARLRTAKSPEFAAQRD